MQRSHRTRALGGLLAALAVLATPALLLAHARLLRSDPSANGRLLSPPASLRLWFSERPELRFTTLQLLDSSGVAVPLGALSLITGDTAGVMAPVTRTIAPGRYTVAWRTAAEDGHATSGRFSFVVAAAATPPQAAAESATAIPSGGAGAQPGRSAQSVANSVIAPSPYAGFSPAFRWAELVALLTLVGAMVFRIFVLQEAKLPPAIAGDAAGRTRRLANALLLLFAITTLWRLAAQADLLPNAGTARVQAMLSVARDTHWGHGWLIGAAGVIVAAVGLATARSMAGWVAASLGVVVICVGESLTGHAVAIRHLTALSISADVTHVLSAGGWLGGLAIVLVCGLPALRAAGREASVGLGVGVGTGPGSGAEPGSGAGAGSGSASGAAVGAGADAHTGGVDERELGQRLVRAYHHAAVQCVALVLVTALVASWLRLTAFSDLWTTAYGRMLFRKVVFVALALIFGLYHWKSIVRPEWRDDTRFRFQRTAIGELMVGAIVLVLTALLVVLPLPGA